MTILIAFTEYTNRILKDKENTTTDEERLRIILDAVPVGCGLWTREFQFLDCNKQALQMIGLEEKTHFEQTFKALLLGQLPDGRSKLDFAHELITEAYDTGYKQIEWEIIGLDGQNIPVELTLIRVQYGKDFAIAAYLRNLREREKMLAELREADERGRLMLDAMPMCCQIFDENLTVMDCNLETLRLFGMNSKQEYLDRFYETSSRPPFQPCGRPSRELAMENLMTTFCDGHRQFEWIIQNTDGALIPTEVTLVRVRYRDGYAVIAYTRDLREMKKREVERQLYELELEKIAMLSEQARVEAERASQAKSDFLINVSHELRTPLNAIIGLSDVMLYLDVDKQQHRYVHEIRSAGQSLLLLINDILEFSSTVSDDLTVHREPFNISELIHSVVEILAPRAAEKNLGFDTFIDASLPSTVYGVMGRVRQVLIIMVKNAIKFTTAGSIRIEVLPSMAGEDTRVMFRVIDTGIGIASDQYDKLFKVFSQVDGSSSRAYGGMGISLALAQRLVQLMGGEVGVESEQNKGSTFWFELPLGCESAAG